MDRLNHLIDRFIDYLPNLLAAVVTLAIGCAAVCIVMRLFRKVLKHSKKIDPAIHPFLLTVVKISLIVLLGLMCLDTLNVKTTPLITALGAVGVAFSLAVKDSLGNLLGGSVLLVTKPFVVGDYCDIGGKIGFIDEIGIVYTVLRTPENEKIYIPNGQVINATVINYYAQENRRLELKFTIDYNADFDIAKDAILRVIASNPMALTDPAPMVRMSGHLDSAIEITCRVWVSHEHYWDLNWDLWEGVKREFDRLGINIPYPQMDVHLKQN